MVSASRRQSPAFGHKQFEMNIALGVTYLDVSLMFALGLLSLDSMRYFIYPSETYFMII